MRKEKITMRRREYLKDVYEGNNEATDNDTRIKKEKREHYVGEDELGPIIMKINSSKESMIQNQIKQQE